MKTSLWLILVLMMIFSMGASSAMAVDNTPPEPVLTAAQESINNFLGHADQEELQKFGFNNQEEIEGASIGVVFRVHLLHPDTVLNQKNATSLLDIADDSNIYQAVIYNGQNPACIITVEQIDNQWAAVSIGGAGLAKQLHEIVETWPGSKGYTHGLIRSLQAKSDFIEIYQNGEQIGIVPLVSAKVSLKLEGGQKNIFLKADEIIETLSPIVMENLRQ